MLKHCKSLLPAILGTVVEYYDYALYGFGVSILALHFFPDDDPNVALLKAFGLFIAGFLAKPLGALIFGTLGDRLGRCLALKISILGIALPTTLIGLLPDHQQLGWVASFLLLVFRILQGIFVSGEASGVTVFIYESVGKKRPYLANSLSNVAQMVGIYLASLAITILGDPELPDWAWRIPFLMSGLFGVIVWICRSTLKETPSFLAYSVLKKEQKASSQSLLNVLFNNKRTLLLSILLFGSVGGGYHFYFTFWGTYLSKVLNMMETTQVMMLSQGVLVYTVFGPISGWLSDRFGPLLIMKSSLLALLLMVIMNAWMVTEGILLKEIILITAGLLALFQAPGGVVFIEKLAVGDRYRGMSLGHAFGSLLFSGSAPIVGLWIWQKTQTPIAPLYYFMGLLCMGYWAVHLMVKKARPKPALQSLALASIPRQKD